MTYLLCGGNVIIKMAVKLSFRSISSQLQQKNRKTIKSTSNITPINKTLDNDVMKHKRIPYIHVNYQLRLIVER